MYVGWWLKEVDVGLKWVVQSFLKEVMMIMMYLSYSVGSHFHLK